MLADIEGIAACSAYSLYVASQSDDKTDSW
jgi:hypothetical protein